MIVHPVELVARQDQHQVMTVRIDVHQVLPYGVGRALVPVDAVDALLGREDLHEPGREIVEPVAFLDVAMERAAVELRQQEDPAQTGVEAVADGDVDEAILAGQRHGGLGAIFRQREEAGAGPAAHDDRDDVVRAQAGVPRHEDTSPKRSIGTRGVRLEPGAA